MITLWSHLKDVRAQPGEPEARLTPLGWTCTETIDGLKGGDYHSSFAQTFFVREQWDTDEIHCLLRQFWEMENSSATDDHNLNSEEWSPLQQVETSLSMQMVGIKWSFRGKRTFLIYQTTMAWRFTDCVTQKNVY